MFTISLEKQNAFTMIAGNLYYELESDGTKIEKVTVPSNTIQEVALTIRSLNGLESIYQLYTSLLPEGISVEYVEDSGKTNEEIGTTNSTKEITVVITNTSEQEVTVPLGVQGGMKGHELVLKENRVAISDPYQFQAEYGYTGDAQSFIAPVSGYYQMEAWGAGGGSTHTSYPGKGAYTSGFVYLEKGTTLYLYIGKKYLHGDTTTEPVFNGGGWSYRSVDTNDKGPYGGGASDIRLVGGTWDNATSLASRIMVAGGGGASELDSNFGGHGGLLGINGYTYTTNNATSNINGGGTQTIGGTTIDGGVSSVKGYDGSFGKGGFYAGPLDLGGGGGGGYYGGSTPVLAGSGGGGSSFISGYAGVNAITSESSITPSNNTLHYSQFYFVDTSIITGVNDTDGKIKITFDGSKHEKTNQQLNQVRYIRDCIDHSSAVASTTNVWVELQAIREGKNVALHKTVTGTGTATAARPYSNIVDGSIATDTLGGTNATGLQCITVDLGQSYDLDEIAVWHYYDDLRSYDHHTLSVSSDNQNYRTLLNQEKMIETESGFHINAWQDTADSTAPTLTLNGGSLIEIVKGQFYEEPGYTAYDTQDGDLTEWVTVYGSVNVWKEGTYHLYYVVHDQAGNYTSQVRTVVVYQNYTLTNLVKNGSFENNFTSWTQVGNTATSNYTQISTSFAKFGTKSYFRGITSSRGQAYIMQPITWTNGHKYYYFLSARNPSSTACTVVSDIYGKGGGIIFSIKSSDLWKKGSSYYSANFNGSNNISVHYGECSINTYVDGVGVIDLTAAFGSGNEPTKAWCDENIDYFDGSKVFKYIGS